MPGHVGGDESTGVGVGGQGSTAYLLCDLGQVTSPSVKGENDFPRPEHLGFLQSRPGVVRV